MNYKKVSIVIGIHLAVCIALIAVNIAFLVIGEGQGEIFQVISSLASIILSVTIGVCSILQAHMIARRDTRQNEKHELQSLRDLVQKDYDYLFTHYSAVTFSAKLAQYNDALAAGGGAEEKQELVEWLEYLKQYFIIVKYHFDSLAMGYEEGYEVLATFEKICRFSEDFARSSSAAAATGKTFKRLLFRLMVKFGAFITQINGTIERYGDFSVAYSEVQGERARLKKAYRAQIEKLDGLMS